MYIIPLNRLPPTVTSISSCQCKILFHALRKDFLVWTGIGIFKFAVAKRNKSSGTILAWTIFKGLEEMWCLWLPSRFSEIQPDLYCFVFELVCVHYECIYFPLKMQSFDSIIHVYGIKLNRVKWKPWTHGSNETNWNETKTNLFRKPRMNTYI